MNEAEMNAVVARVPFFRFIGFSVTETSAETCQATLPFRETLIGNPVARNFHGGIVANLMEALASLAVMRDSAAATPKPVNITVDYLRPARAATRLNGIFTACGSTPRPITSCTATWSRPAASTTTMKRITASCSWSGCSTRAAL